MKVEIRRKGIIRILLSIILILAMTVNGLPFTYIESAMAAQLPEIITPVQLTSSDLPYHKLSENISVIKNYSWNTHYVGGSVEWIGKAPKDKPIQVSSYSGGSVDAGDTVLFRIANSFIYGSKSYDVYVKLTTDIGYTGIGVNPNYKVQSDKGIQILPNGGKSAYDGRPGAKDFDYELWLQDGDRVVNSNNVPFAIKTIWMAGYEYLDIYGNNDIVFSNYEDGMLLYNETYGWHTKIESSDTTWGKGNREDRHIFVDGHSRNHSVLGGYYLDDPNSNRPLSGGGIEFTLGSIEINNTNCIKFSGDKIRTPQVVLDKSKISTVEDPTTYLGGHFLSWISDKDILINGVNRVAGTPIYHNELVSIDSISNEYLFTACTTDHDWNYLCSDNELKAYCKVSGCSLSGTDAKPSSRLKLNVCDANYSGTAVTASYGTGEADSWKTAVGNDAPTITYEQKGADNNWSAIASAPVNTGEYRAVAKVTKDSTDYIAYKEFTISKAEIDTVTYTEPTVAATGTPATVTGLAIASTANYTGAISWAPADTSFKYNTAYTATVTLSAKDNYKFADGVTFPTGWTKDTSSTETSLVLTKTYDATAKAKITSVTAPSVTTELEAFTTESAQIAALPTSVTVAVEDNSKTSMAITWALKDGTTYSTASEEENTFVWTVIASEYADLDTNSKTLTGEVILKNPKHNHDWKYTVDGATLYAKCSKGGTEGCAYDDNYKVSLTLTASSPNYSGSAAAITLVGKETWKAALGDDLTPKEEDIKYYKGAEALTEASTTPGDYTAKITAGNATASVSFTISVAKNAEEVAAAKSVAHKITTIGTVEYTDACKTKIDEARKAYDELSEHLISLVTNYNVLTTAEAKYAELKVAADKLKADTVSANAVDTLIKSIGKVEYTDACKARIDEARKAYEALTSEQKTIVKELKTLEAAEKEYEKLKEANKPNPNPNPNPDPEETIFDTAYDNLKLVEIVNKKGKTTGYTISANSLSMKAILTVNAKLKLTLLGEKWTVAGYSEERVTGDNLANINWLAAGQTKADAKALKKYAKAKFYKQTKKNEARTLITTVVNKKDLDGVYAVKLVNENGDVIILDIEYLKIAKAIKNNYLKTSASVNDISSESLLAMEDGDNAKTVSISHIGKNKEVNKSAFNKNGVEWKLGSGKKAATIKYGEVTEYKNKKGEVIAYLTLTKDGSVKVVAGSKKGKVKLSAKVNGKTYKTTVTIKEK